MNNSWNFDNNDQIVRYVNALVEDSPPFMESNDPSVVTNETAGFEQNRSMYYSSTEGRMYPYYPNSTQFQTEPDVNTFQAQPNGDRQRDSLEKRENDFFRSNSKEKICRFCKNNGEPHHVYASHPMKDKRGRVVCLKLRSFKCPICGATGDDAHTKKYCTYKPLKC